MMQPPDFDPFELLGVDASADAATIDRAYKARIRYVHPDIAGPAGLNETKRLNIAREWLVDPDLRAQLPQPAAAAPTSPAKTPDDTTPSWWDRTTRPRTTTGYDPLRDDPTRFDYGTRTTRLRAFFDTIRGLSSDERARVTYSLGDEPPLFFDEFKNLVSEQLWARSKALADAISSVWTEREDEDTPLLFPTGRVFGNGVVVANAYAQWLLLGDAIRQRTFDTETIDALEQRSTWPWDASVGYVRYGPAQLQVEAFLVDARALSATSAERLSRSWHRHMGTYLYGRPGEDWFPSSPADPRSQLVSARLAAVDASRIEPPVDLPNEHHSGYRYGLRLTAYVLALGGPGQAGRDYLRPWREALDESPSFWDRARWAMPLG